MKTLILRGEVEETLRRPGACGFSPGVVRPPVIRLESTKTLEPCLRAHRASLVSIRNLCIQRAGDTRYPDIPRVFSVRTEDLPAGLLHVGEPPLCLYGAYGKSAPPNTQRIQAWIKTVGAARVVRTTSFQFESNMRGQVIREAKNVSDRVKGKYKS